MSAAEKIAAMEELWTRYSTMLTLHHLQNGMHKFWLNGRLGSTKMKLRFQHSKRFDPDWVSQRLRRG
jgi:hypothetical protein